MASYITSNLQEVASIWCFSSIGQIVVIGEFVAPAPPLALTALLAQPFPSLCGC